jgi:hypothetical protein
VQLKSEAMGGVEVLREKDFQHDKETNFIIEGS